MARTRKETFPDKVIRIDMAIAGKQVTIQYLGTLSSTHSLPRLANGQIYGKEHTHAIIINHEYKCFI